MIFGACPVADSQSGNFYCNGWNSEHPELSLNLVRTGDFSGGFLTHPRLPYSKKDFFYRDEDLDITVLLSGSVFNRKELHESEKMESTITDPELIGRLFLLHGEQFAGMLNGDFAFFIFRGKRAEAYLYRDQVGIRPLAWIFQDGILAF